jgi:hypothetical protein
MVCGVHAFFGGGCSPEQCAFVDVDSYIITVEGSRPGDWFTLWSVPLLADQELLLIRKQRTQVTEDELQKARDWLNEDAMREYLAAGYRSEGVPPVARWGDSDFFDELQEMAHICSPEGEFAALALTALHEGEDTTSGAPRFHLVDARRPNDRGEVPLGGSY